MAVACLLLRRAGGASRRVSPAAISNAVTSLSAQRIKPTLVSISDDRRTGSDAVPALKGPDYGADSNDLFDGYGRHRAYDEMFDRAGEVRAQCAALFDELRR